MPRMGRARSQIRWFFFQLEKNIPDWQHNTISLHPTPHTHSHTPPTLHEILAVARPSWKERFMLCNISQWPLPPIRTTWCNDSSGKHFFIEFSKFYFLPFYFLQFYFLLFYFLQFYFWPWTESLTLHTCIPKH